MLTLFLAASLPLLELCQQAAASLPIIITLGLIAGRRGNSQFYLAGNRTCLKLCLWCAFLGIFYFPLAYLREILSFSQNGGEIWSPFFQPAGLPWSTATFAQLLGLLSLFFAKQRLAFISPEKYTLRKLCPVLAPLIFTSILCGGTFFLINWPFGGYPAGLSFERIFMAVSRNAAAHYFMAFCPGGAIGLIWTILITHKKQEITQKEKILAFRWMSVWAFIGYLPWLLQSWAILIGVSLRGDIGLAGPGYLAGHVTALAILSLALCFWLFQALSKKALPLAGAFAFLLFLIFKYIP